MKPALPPAPAHGRQRPIAAAMAALLALAACATASSSRGWSQGLADTGSEAPPPVAAPSADELAASFLVGRFALDQGDYKVAAESFEQALKADPTNVELQQQLVALRIADGDFEGAKAAATRLVALDPGADEAQLLLALDASRRGDHAQAVHLLQELGATGLPGTVRPILLAWAQFDAGQEAKARETLRAPAARGGLDRLHAYHRAVMLGLSGAPQQGLELLRSTFGNPAAAPERVVREAASLEHRAGRQDEALALLAQARAQDPEDRQLEAIELVLRQGGDPGAVRNGGDGMGDALIEVAQALAEQDGNAQALLFARLASFVRPDDASAYLVIAAVLLRQDHPEAALKALDQVSADSPLAWQAGFARARALEALDRTDEAVALLTEMTDSAPTRVDAPTTLGDLLRGKERYAEAEQAYTKAIQRLPGLRSQDWRLLYARGITFERTKRWPQAEADLLKALELQPDEPLVLNYLGYSWVDQHQNLERAKGMLHRAVELRPNDGFIVDSLGWAYFRLGDYDQAVSYLDRAVELEPGDAVINDHLGDALWRVGRQREARFQWSRSLTLDPEPDLVTSIQDKLVHGLAPQAERSQPERKG
ncbi:MAG: tetratricopeptide repeat protein [Geminicoccaceae bacterium]